MLPEEAEHGDSTLKSQLLSYYLFDPRLQQKGEGLQRTRGCNDKT